MSERISIVMPSLNMAPFIGAALASIARQGAHELLVFVADAGSTDGTREVAVGYRDSGLPISMLEVEPGSSPAVARNAALGEVNSDLVAFLDADDLWPAGKLDRQVAFLDEHPALGMVSGYVRYFDKADESGLQPSTESRLTDLVHVHVGACIYRRETLAMLGDFDSELRYGEDVDLLMKLRESGVDFAILRSIELYYRKHPGAMTAQADPRQASDFRRVALKSLQRRRLSGTADRALPDLADYVVP
jgi:glycosyltransferase involved in cell wall biosynthesis